LEEVEMIFLPFEKGGKEGFERVISHSSFEVKGKE